ncbi:MAG: pyridoxal phosphate-dependent decarboxylase family protein [Solirubrobacterales bacterium]|jgi:glutamate/tyrosine decarboxylase-like PLP-dependent enzyme
MDEFDLPVEEVRRLGYLAADAVAEHRAGLRDRPVFGKIGPLATLFDGPLPETGLPIDEVMAFVREHILTHPFGNSHARFFAFINATADPVGTVADYLASAMNPNCWGGDHAAIHVERQVVRWLAEVVGLPGSAEGILTSGGSMANFTALSAARSAMAPAVREDGMAGVPRIVVYASDQVHNCVDKAVDLLGIGLKQLHKVPTDEHFRIRVDRLRAMIDANRAAGLVPAIVVGNAGTVNTGAIDPLDELADLCARESLWFHADGAYGGMATISPALRPLFRGIERAHSVATDPHKWLYVPYEAGAALVRDAGRLADAFRKPADYLVHDKDSPVNGPVSFNERGPELSRSFKALKVWMGLKRHGRSGYARAIEHDVAMARFLADTLQGRPDFELLAEPVLSIVNFRYRPAGARPDDASLDSLNRRIVNRLVASGAFFLAPTILKGRASMRAAIVNFRTTEADLVALADEAARAGREILGAEG